MMMIIIIITLIIIIIIIITLIITLIIITPIGMVYPNPSKMGLGYTVPKRDLWGREK